VYEVKAREWPRTHARLARDRGKRLAARGRTEWDKLAYRRGRADVAIFHQFMPAPWGGGNQFLVALSGELERRGLTIEVDRISGQTPACLFNSYNFDFVRLRRFARPDCRLVHRVDGPIGVYRGADDGTDRRIHEINRELADATVFQSRYSLEKHRELGLELVDPVMIPNTVDPRIFYPPSSRTPLDARRVRLIATSWSSNPKKGAEILTWLDRNLDFERYEMTFAGQTQERFANVRVLAPVPSEQLAGLLRAQDLYLAPSRDDPCSNALLEALACGLPAAFLRSGGHPELVGEGGIGFDRPEELPETLNRLTEELDTRRAAIRVSSLAEVADRYLEVLRG
jgi:glycosyltransferase involved in cell wall biosynthesis